MNNPNMKNEYEKMFFTQLIIVFALLAVFVALLAISVASLFQTEQAFQPLNDPDIVVLGFALGNYMSIFFALIAQYTQNVALYIKKHYCTGKVIFKSELPLIGEFEFTDNNAADTAFWTSFTIDSMTNVVWFYQNVTIPKDIVLGTMLRIIGYTAMIGSTLAEEAMGVVLDALKKAWKQMSDIAYQNKRVLAKEKKQREIERKRDEDELNRLNGSSQNENKPERQQGQNKPSQNSEFSRPPRPDSGHNMVPMMGADRNRQRESGKGEEPVYNNPNYR